VHHSMRCSTGYRRMTQARSGAQCRREAGMLRRSAEVVKDPRLRKQLLQIVAQYEHLVRNEEALCSGRGSEADGAREQRR
jgi:hypothetical protein